MNFGRFLHFAAGATALVACCVTAPEHSAWSQPRQSIKVVVPFPPGGGADILARVLGEQIGKTQRQTVVIENRPGAGASIGYEAVARAAPDGNTLLIAANSLVINPILRKLNYDPVSSFEPICHLVNSPLVIAVDSASPYRTLNDLVAAARAKPGELSLAGTGPGAAQHIAIERFKQLAKVDMIYIPYPGGAPAVNAALGGHVTGVLENYSLLSEQINSGKLRPLATASLSRIEPLPNVPTVAESGFKGYEADVWLESLRPPKRRKS